MFTSIRSRFYDDFQPQQTQCVNRTGGALSAGDVVALDLTGSDADVEAYSDYNARTDKESTHPFANVIAPATAHLEGWVFVVATEAVADDAVGWFTQYGVVDVLVATGTSAGDQLSGTNASNTLDGIGAGEAVLALLLEDNSSGSDATRPAIFNGMAVGGGAS